MILDFLNIAIILEIDGKTFRYVKTLLAFLHHQKTAKGKNLSVQYTLSHFTLLPLLNVLQK